MKDEQHRFLALMGNLPARLSVEQTAWMLNCQPHDIPVLVAGRLLKPLGNPAPNAVKFFSRSEVLELTNDRAWLVRMTNAISQHWHKKNLQKKARSANGVNSRLDVVTSVINN